MDDIKGANREEIEELFPYKTVMQEAFWEGLEARYGKGNVPQIDPTMRLYINRSLGGHVHGIFKAEIAKAERATRREVARSFLLIGDAMIRARAEKVIEQNKEAE